MDGRSANNGGFRDGRPATLTDGPQVRINIVVR
jgi:hypothetical protein